MRIEQARVGQIIQLPKAFSTHHWALRISLEEQLAKFRKEGRMDLKLSRVGTKEILFAEHSKEPYGPLLERWKINLYMVVAKINRGYVYGRIIAKVLRFENLKPLYLLIDGEFSDFINTRYHKLVKSGEVKKSIKNLMFLEGL